MPATCWEDAVVFSDHLGKTHLSSLAVQEHVLLYLSMDRIVIAVFTAFLFAGAAHRSLEGSSLHWASMPVLSLAISYVFWPPVAALLRRLRAWPPLGEGTPLESYRARPGRELEPLPRLRLWRSLLTCSVTVDIVPFEPPRSRRIWGTE